MERALDLVGTRSATTLLREAFYGATRSDDLVRRSGVTPAVGSKRLRDMVTNGLLEREPCQEPGQRTRSAYTITELGQELFPIIAALAHLGDGLPGDPEKTVLLHLSPTWNPRALDDQAHGPVEGAGTGRARRVAATGAVIARQERRRRAYTPDEIRERLHARLATPPASGGETD